MAVRVDISKDYATSRCLGVCCLILFWANVAFVFISLLPFDTIANAFCIAQSISAIAFMVLEFVDDYYYWYFAERARRRHLIEDAFGIDLAGGSSEGYYNNLLPSGSSRLIVDAFESIFFTLRIVQAMVPWSLAKGLLALLSFVFVIMALHSSSLFPVITQTIFSSYLLMGSVKLLIYESRLEHLYDDMYRSCVTTGLGNHLKIARAQVDVEEYECLKAHFKVRLSERLYNKLNPALSEEWAGIAVKIQVRETSKTKR